MVFMSVGPRIIQYLEFNEKEGRRSVNRYARVVKRVRANENKEDRRALTGELQRAR